MTEAQREQWERIVQMAGTKVQCSIGMYISPDSLVLAVNAELEALRSVITEMEADYLGMKRACDANYAAAQEEVATLRTSLSRHLEEKRRLNEQLGVAYQALQRMVDSFHPHPRPDTEGWREEHEACAWALAVLEEKA